MQLTLAALERLWRRLLVKLGLRKPPLPPQPAFPPEVVASWNREMARQLQLNRVLWRQAPQMCRVYLRPLSPQLELPLPEVLRR